MNFVWSSLAILFILIGWLYIDYMFGKKEHVKTSLQREYPVRDNEKLEIFSHGPDLFSDIFHEIENAQEHVHILFYIAKSDKISQDFYDLLKRKAKQGVDVRLMVDWLNSLQIKKEIITELQDAHVQFARSYVPKPPFYFYSLNVRNHRKITVIDGRIGYVGGFNVGKEYIDQDPKLNPWRDYHLKISGESVQDLQQEFLLDWDRATHTERAEYQTTNRLPDTAFSMETSTELTGDEGSFLKNKPMTMPLKLVSSDGVKLEETFIERIRQSKKSIFIGTPYFIPSKPLLAELIAAARRGVKITILVPKKSDHILVKEASFTYLRTLIKEGADVYEFLNGFYHAKAFLFDDEVCDIGTSNFDKRSLFLNQEINCFIFDKTEIERVKQIINNDLNDSKKLTLEELNSVGLWARLKEWIAKPVSPLL